MLPESSSRVHKQFILKTPIKSLESRGFFWDGRLTANNQYFNLGLNKTSIQLLNMYNVLFSMPRFSTSYPMNNIPFLEIKLY
jgi:hypothetical protein